MLNFLQIDIIHTPVCIHTLVYQFLQTVALSYLEENEL